MKYRKLRIAWSAVCVAASVLVVVFWVRSYRYDKAAGIHGGQLRAVTSSNRLFICWSKLGAMHLGVARPPSSGSEWDLHFAAARVLGFGYVSQSTCSAMRVPYWFILMTMCLGVAFPWTPYFRLRFSMREMLVAVSVVAGVLGLLAYAARN